MLLIAAAIIALLGVALAAAGLVENPALMKFVGGMVCLDIAGAIAAAWASTKGPGR